MNFLEDLEAGIIEAAVQGALQKAAQNLVQKGDLTPAQEPIVVAGVMDALEALFKLYKQSQTK